MKSEALVYADGLNDRLKSILVADKERLMLISGLVLLAEHAPYMDETKVGPMDGGVSSLVVWAALMFDVVGSCPKSWVETVLRDKAEACLSKYGGR